MIGKGGKNLRNIAFFIHPMINFLFLMSTVAYLDRFSYILILLFNVQQNPSCDNWRPFDQQKDSCY